MRKIMQISTRDTKKLHKCSCKITAIDTTIMNLVKQKQQEVIEANVEIEKIRRKYEIIQSGYEISINTINGNIYAKGCEHGLD